MKRDYINIICELVSNEIELTTKVLNENGISSKDISNLIEVGFLVREKRGLYVLNRWEFMFDFGKNLLIKGEFDKAKSCFRVLCRDDESQREPCFDKFLNFVIDNNYNEAVAILEVMCEVDDVRINKKVNLRLFLLNELDLLPEHLKERAKRLQLGDLMGSASIEDDLSDDVIAKIFGKQFACAKKEIASEETMSGPYCEAIRNLLSQIINKRFSYENELARQKRYGELIDYLDEIFTLGDLTSYEKASLSILKDLIAISNGREIPAKNNKHYKNSFVAINDRQYSTALELHLNYLAKKDREEKGTLLLILLKEIVRICEEKEKELEAEKTQVSEQFKEHPTMAESKIDFFEIIRLLVSNDIPEAKSILSVYIERLGLSQYKSLLEGLIDLGLMENDTNFDEFIVTLTHLSIGHYKFDSSKYVRCFYESMASVNYRKAGIYLDILHGVEDLDVTVDVRLLDELLNNVESLNSVSVTANQKVELRREYNIVSQNNPASQESPIEIFYLDEKRSEGQQRGQVSNTQKIGDKKSYNSETIEKEEEKIRDFIMGKMDSIEKRGVHILKPMSSYYRRLFHKVADEMQNVTSFSIGRGIERRVVLKYTVKHDDFDVRETLLNGNDAFKSKDYEGCIESYKKVLETTRPRTFVYVKLGLAYYKLGYRNLAIDYLTIATELNNQGIYRLDRDYSSLIGFLRGEIEPEDTKPYVRMREKDFERDTSDYYGIEQVEQIVKAISLGAEPEIACHQFGLDSVKTAIVLLVIARDCYAQGNDSLGDSYMKRVEKIEGKSGFVNSLFNEIRKNRKFYKNRNSEEDKHFVLNPILFDSAGTVEN